MKQPSSETDRGWGMVDDTRHTIRSDRRRARTWPRGPRRVGIAAAIAGLSVGLAACSSGSTTVTRTTTTTAGGTTTTTAGSSSQAAQDLPNGIYTDGTQGTPHYFITLTTHSDGSL